MRTCFTATKSRREKQNMARPGPLHTFDRWLQGAIRYEEDWRKEAQKSVEYYDCEQWTDEEEAVLTERGQAATVLNLIRPTIDSLIGTQAERRIDFQILPREPSDEAMALLLTELLKQVFDASMYEYYETQVFRQGITAGRGAFEVRFDKGANQVMVDQIPFDEVYIDPYHRKPDASDARWIAKIVWLDRDEAKDLYGEKAELIDSAFTDEYEGIEYKAQQDAPDRAVMSYYDRPSNRIMVVEMWYRMKGKLHYVVFSDEVFLEGSDGGENPSPLPDSIQVFPIVPYYSFRKHDGQPQSLIEFLRPLQDQLNKENSKYLWTISANRVYAEKDALDDPDEAREEMNRPDGFILLKQNGLGKIKTEDNLRESQQLMAHMQWLIMLMQRISGVNDAAIGIGGTNERSATQQATRIMQGAQMQTSIIENLLFTKRIVAETVLRFVGGYYTDRRVVRQMASNGQFTFAEINAPAADADGQTWIENEMGDVLRFDVLLRPTQAFSSVRQLALQTFAEIAKAVPLPPEIVAEIFIENSDFPNKRDLIRRVQEYQNAQAKADAAAGAAEAIPQQSPTMPGGV